MITVNTYHVTERAVAQGVTAAVEQLLKDPTVFQQPQQVVEGIVSGVMQELGEVFDFGIQPIRFTRDLMTHAMMMAAQQPQAEEQ
jgi:hypothetical protein